MNKVNYQQANAFDTALFGDRRPDEVTKPVTPDGRNARGQFTPGHKATQALREKRVKTITSRQKGQPQTPNMNFAGKINWLNCMLASIRLSGYIYNELKKHPARANLQPWDELKLREFEQRAVEIQQLANDLHVEIAAWNKKKKMRKIVE
jgi:hypothetical protein